MTKTMELEATPVVTTRFPWAPILILGFAWFLGVAIELSPAGLLSDIAADLDVTAAGAGTLTTFYALGNAILVLPLTAIAIRFSRRTALNVVMIVFVISNLVVAAAPNLFAADAGRFLGGACYALICTLFPAVAIRIAGPQHAGKAITVIFAATSLGTALGAPIASLAGNAFGWRITFLAAAVLALIAGILMSFIVPAVHVKVQKSLTLMETARLPGVLRVAIGWALVMLAHFVILTYIDAYLENLGVPTYITSVTLFLIGIGGLVGTILISRVSNKSVFAALIAAPVTVAVGLAFLFLSNGNLVVVLIAVALWGTGIAAAVVAYQQSILLTGRRAPEMATSIGVLLAQAGFATGSTVGGITLDFLGVAAIPLVALVFVAGSIIIATTLRPIIHAAQQ
ncbi:putative MFS family arabinose efflux permease [Arthrobacter sp. CAN_A6]|uniref:MFS transporter n=1 Tax=Arthrobacter sp. CAN_A6 TaxID=2787721 RepID=UPI0018CB965E